MNQSLHWQDQIHSLIAIIAGSALTLLHIGNQQAALQDVQTITGAIIIIVTTVMHLMSVVSVKKIPATHA